MLLLNLQNKAQIGHCLNGKALPLHPITTIT